jgi:hemolysin activation/secretion protein
MTMTNHRSPPGQVHPARGSFGPKRPRLLAGAATALLCSMIPSYASGLPSELQWLTAHTAAPAGQQPDTAARVAPVAGDELRCAEIRRVVLDEGEGSGRFQFALRAIPGLAGWETKPLCLTKVGIDQILLALETSIRDAGYTFTEVRRGPNTLVTPGELRVSIFPGRLGVTCLVAPAAARAAGFGAAAWPAPRGGSSEPAGQAVERTPPPAPDAACDRDQTLSKSQLSWAMVQRQGEIFHLRDLEQGFENLQRLPTADVGIKLLPRPAIARSDIVILRQQESKLRASASLDDSGARATGRYLATAAAACDDCLGINDILAASITRNVGGGSTKQSGNEGTTVDYSFPRGYWSFGATLSDGTYRQEVACVPQPCVYSGKSSMAAMRIANVVYRDQTDRALLSARLWTRQSSNFIDDTEIEVQRRRSSAVELAVAYKGCPIGLAPQTMKQRLAEGPVCRFGVFFEGDATYRKGIRAFGATPAAEEAFGEGTSTPTLLLFSVQAQLLCRKRPPGQLPKMVTVALRSQWTGDVLTVQDRFAIGGRHTVRGFDGEFPISGERGWVLRTEGELCGAPALARPFLALDLGAVSGPSTAQLAGKHLAGAAAGVRGVWRIGDRKQRVAYELFVAHPVKQPAVFPAKKSAFGFNLYWTTH